MAKIGLISAPALMRRITLNVRLTGVNQLRLRLWLGCHVMKLAALIMGCHIEIEQAQDA